MKVEFLQGVTLNPDVDKSTYASRLNLLKGRSCKREMHAGDLRVHMVMGLTPGGESWHPYRPEAAADHTADIQLSSRAATWHVK